MKHLLICFLGIILLISCKQKDTKSKSSTISELEPPRKDKVVTPEYVILKFDSTMNWLFKDSKPAELNLSEVKEIELILSKCINAYNPKQLKKYEKIIKENPGSNFTKPHLIIDLKRYDRQYIAVFNSKGEKEVWVNCFCVIASNSWKKKIEWVKDGGNCYFSLKINLSKKTYYDFGVNGEA